MKKWGITKKAHTKTRNRIRKSLFVNWRNLEYSFMQAAIRVFFTMKQKNLDFLLSFCFAHPQPAAHAKTENKNSYVFFFYFSSSVNITCVTIGTTIHHLFIILKHHYILFVLLLFYFFVSHYFITTTYVLFTSRKTVSSISYYHLK